MSLTEKQKTNFLFWICFTLLFLQLVAFFGLYLFLNPGVKFRFENPSYLFFILVPAGITWLYRLRNSKALFHFPSSTRFVPLTTWKNRFKSIFPRLILTFIFLFCFVALAKPQLGQKQIEVETEGIDIILTLDTSGSMQALDFELGTKTVDRLTVVKKVVVDFVRSRMADRIGLVVFGSVAFTQSPLTVDYDVLTQLVSGLQVGVSGEGTAIGDGLALSIKRLKDTDSKSKIIILLTDGKSNSGSISPLKAAEIAKTYHIKVYTIGVGTKGEVPIRQKTPFGTRLIPVRVDLDEETLQHIANITGGEYFHAADTHKLESIYKEIDKMEKTKSKVKQYEIYRELFPFLVCSAFILLIFYELSLTFWIKRLEP